MAHAHPSRPPGRPCSHAPPRFLSTGQCRRLEPHSPLPRRLGNLTAGFPHGSSPRSRSPRALGVFGKPSNQVLKKCHFIIGWVSRSGGRAPWAGGNERRPRERFLDLPCVTQQKQTGRGASRRRGLAAAADQMGAAEWLWPPCAWRQAPPSGFRFPGPFPNSDRASAVPVGFVGGGRRQKQGCGWGVLGGVAVKSPAAFPPAVALRSRRVGGGRDRGMEVLAAATAHWRLPDSNTGR